jgi:peptidoglycan L-alanyl-D-glutamate endopeptidase CwlK
MSSKLISDLLEEMRGMATVHKQLCEANGIELLIYCTLRSNEEQTALYDSGRTAKGKIVTNARAGESAHNPDKDGYAHAYDCCPMVSGKPIWDTSDPKWAIVGKCGEEAGLSWSGRWTGKMKEMAHFEDTKWKKEVNHG